ncbi:MAG: acetyl-CoA carboxylase biotin carboxyl carrier protein [Acholeplasmataceae bacterium]|jgi:acetyl-CoA carboxylase biotin carboxyl carrier protein
MKIKEIQEIIENFEKSSLQTLELELENFKLKLSKLKEAIVSEPQIIHSKNINQHQETSLPLTKENDLTSTVVKSPLVGTYYAASSPDQPPFIEVGQSVKKGQVLMIVEAMKIMNEITSPIDGVIKEIHVKNGDIIQYDQVLVTIGESHAK